MGQWGGRMCPRREVQHTQRFRGSAFKELKDASVLGAEGEKEVDRQTEPRSYVKDFGLRHKANGKSLEEQGRNKIIREFVLGPLRCGMVYRLEEDKSG